ncbi:MAG: SRPBCC family protein [Candidatus Poribacteria bacterium]|nr:SRPBCC family protein [Candidatus Poribacteria bacterium]
MPRLSTSISIKASRNIVFQILEDVENYPQYFHYVRHAKILRREGNTMVAEIDEVIYGLPQHLQTRFRFLPPDHIEAEQIKGPFQSARAWFQLEENAEGTQLEHTAEFEIGRGIVGKLIHRFIADSYAQDRMAEELAAIKQVAEAKARETWSLKRNG